MYVQRITEAEEVLNALKGQRPLLCFSCHKVVVGYYPARILTASPHQEYCNKISIHRICYQCTPKSITQVNLTKYANQLTSNLIYHYSISLGNGIHSIKKSIPCIMNKDSL